MNIEFDRCIDFLTRMIEKYGDEIAATEEDSRDNADQSIVAANEAKDTNDVCS